MEKKTTVSARQREATYPDEKKSADSDIDFFPPVFLCISNMIVRWEASSLRPPHIFVARVQLSVLNSSRLAVNSKKHDSSHSLHLSYRGQKHIRLRWFHTCTEGFDTPGFF